MTAVPLPAQPGDDPVATVAFRDAMPGSPRVVYVDRGYRTAGAPFP